MADKLALLCAFLCFCHFPIWCPGSGVVLFCIGSCQLEVSVSSVVSAVSLSLSHWYPGSGVVLDCIDS